MIAVSVVGLWAIGCDGDAPPPPPPPDANPRFDGAIRDTSPSDANPRRDASTLPVADIEVVLPYLGPEQSRDRVIQAQPGKLDVHFSIDTTGSFGGEIDALQSDLSRRIIPDLEEQVDDVAFGVSRFEDFPFEPYGFPLDSPFELLSPITTDRTRVSSGVAQLDQPLGSGGDVAESGYEALYQIATGAGFERFGVEYIPTFDGDGDGDLGGVGFREGALHIVVHTTDAPSHTPATYLGPPSTSHDADDVARAMANIDGHVIGIASSDTARPQLVDMALRTNAVIPPEDGECATGIDGQTRDPVDGVCPLVFDIDPTGTGLSSAIVGAIVGLLDSVRYAEVYGLVLNDRTGFVQAVEAIDAEVPEGGSAPLLADRRPMDGIDDTFVDVRIGTAVRFAIRLRNERIPPASYDQIFHLTVQIVGDGLVLDQVVIRVTVPFGRLDAAVPDTGTDASGDATGDAAAVDAGADI